MTTTIPLTMVQDAATAPWLARGFALLAQLATHDPATRAHCQRVAQIVGPVAQQLGLPMRDCYAVQIAAWFHDIGKLGISSTLLQQITPLAEHEYLWLQQHADIGARQLSHGGVPASIVAMVRAHHERWDGTGYPTGLVGDAIPLGARIIGVVDAFDVMTHGRPYVDACSVEDACVRLQDEVDRAWDGYVVDALIQVVERGVAQEVCYGTG